MTCSLCVFYGISLLTRVMKLRSHNADRNHSNPAAWFNEPGNLSLTVSTFFRTLLQVMPSTESVGQH